MQGWKGMVNSAGFVKAVWVHDMFYIGFQMINLLLRERYCNFNELVLSVIADRGCLLCHWYPGQYWKRKEPS